MTEAEKRLRQMLSVVPDEAHTLRPTDSLLVSDLRALLVELSTLQRQVAEKDEALAQARHDHIALHDGINKISFEAQELARANSTEAQWAQVRRLMDEAAEHKRRRREAQRRTVAALTRVRALDEKLVALQKEKTA